jgi:hypothetical protein
MPGRGLLFLAFGFLLLQVIIPTMMLQPHILRLEVVFSMLLTSGFTPGDFVLRRMLNRDRVNKFS